MFLRSWFLLILAVLVSGGLMAWSLFDTEADERKPTEHITKRVEQVMNGVTVTGIEESEIPGIYQVTLNNALIVFASEDGQHIIAGRDIALWELRDSGLENLTDARRAVTRKDELAKLTEDKMVVFKPEGEVKAVVYAFTDVDCGFCRKLHNEIQQITALGVQVNYLAFPRAGVSSNSADKLRAVWCAPNKEQAMTVAKSGANVTEFPADCEEPIAEHFFLGERVGVSGTPAIFTADGMQIGGYISPDEFKKRLAL